MYFNWRCQGKDHRPPVNYDWMVELLLECLKLDNEMLKLIQGAILSEVYGAAFIMMQSQGLIDIPDWMLAQYQHPGHNFETGQLGNSSWH